MRVIFVLGSYFIAGLFLIAANILYSKGHLPNAVLLVLAAFLAVPFSHSAVERLIGKAIPRLLPTISAILLGVVAYGSALNMEYKQYLELEAKEAQDAQRAAEAKRARISDEFFKNAEQILDEVLRIANAGDFSRAYLKLSKYDDLNDERIGETRERLSSLREQHEVARYHGLQADDELLGRWCWDRGNPNMTNIEVSIVKSAVGHYEIVRLPGQNAVKLDLKTESPVKFVRKTDGEVMEIHQDGGLLFTDSSGTERFSRLSDRAIKVDCVAPNSR